MLWTDPGTVAGLDCGSQVWLNCLELPCVWPKSKFLGLSIGQARDSTLALERRPIVRNVSYFDEAY
jgi:hypothetical protein